MKNIKILKKLELKKRLTEEEITKMVNDFNENKITKEEMTAFLKLIYKNGFSLEETIYLTKAMLNSGEIVNLDKVEKKVVDKHSTGGIGDKVSLIIGPVIASVDLAIAKMSGRSLGFTGGTIDKLESIPGYDVNISERKFINMLNKVGVSIISQTTNIAPADKKIYALRDITNTTDSIPLIASSVMSKKIACGSDIIVIDLKVGCGAFMKNIRSATKLAKTMIKIGEYFNKKVICILTNMDYPLGYTVGNALEVEEVIEYFDGKREKRLDKVVKNIATYLTAYGKMISIEEAKREVNKVLKDGSAKNKFYEWIKAQGGKINNFKIDANVLYIKSTKNGYIKNIDALKIGEFVNKLGAGRTSKKDSIDKNVGIKLYKTVGSKVNVGDVLGAIYYNKEIKNMMELFLEAFTITPKKRKNESVILKIIR